ncbi:MAG: DNA/RNA helicase domain-containing protein, partial [bacterium]
RGNLALEYQLPASPSWCDVVLLGEHESRASAVIVELKDWATRGDTPGSYEGLMLRQGAQELHPSDQVRGYTQYCRRFHSAVQDHDADVHGCVLFTRDRWTDAYTSQPNDKLAAEYPLFTTAEEDVDNAFPLYFSQRLTEANEAFAHAFEQGTYRQKRGFVAQIGAQLLDPATSAFELLDGQRKAFAECSSVIRASFHGSGKKQPPKRVVIIKGPPGSGKSAIAARLWASLVTDTKLPDGDVVMTTTSTSQNKNWAYLFDQVSAVPGARGVIRKATGYTPINTHDLGRERKRRGENWLHNASEWRENLRQVRALGLPFRDATTDDANLVSIVDEAHALINPEHNEGRGQFGFVVTLGPQAYHIIRTSMLSVFLLDPLQGFRQRENTSVDDIRTWAKELGAGDPIEISLDGLQFRCAGSVDYVAWVESMLRGAPAADNAAIAAKWHHPTMRAKGTSPTMDVRVFSEPEEWEATLRARSDEGSTVRLLSTYSRQWKTKSATRPHDLGSSDVDFNEPYLRGGTTRRWSRIWNHVPREDYSWFVAGRPGGEIAEDPLCEVGCPYVVRGFDFDYVGILWLDDLVWRHGCWEVNPIKVHETGVSQLARAAQKEAKNGIRSTSTNALLERVAQTYRILFTRALKGAYIWVPDDETRAYLVDSLAV